ncbi:hypothetical protein C2I06_09555 [Niallia circulans]|uniref:hypothetical protein n=1 Tax=Niallia circulans TaxID=1397 RepID=UPI000F44C9E7|nr:hypothetical protein [Niallia circulans]AYV67101.1 hypothetical protein C2I06_09555 [Niallia circulans]
MSNLHFSEVFIKNIREQLNTDFFVSEDFVIETKDFSPKAKHLYIIYKYQKDYEFKLRYMLGNDSFSITMQPGDIIFEQKEDELTSEEVREQIDSWLKNIYNSLSAQPLNRKVSEHEEMLNEVKEKIDSLEGFDDFFTREESKIYIQKLNELENRFKEQFEEEQINRENTEEQIQSLQKDIEVLKTQLDMLTKKNWILSFSTRLYNLYKQNPIVARKLAGAGRELLPDAAKEFVTPELLDQALLPPESAGNE